MSVLYLAFETNERQNRLVKLQKSGAHIVVAEPRWPGFFELAKREKPFAIAIDFSSAPSHALETADYLTKAKETKEATMFLLRVSADRLEGAQKRLPNATIVTESELSARLAQMEQEAEARARQKKEAAAQAKKAARAAARAAAGLGAEKGKPAPAPAKAKAAAKPVAKPAAKAAPKAAHAPAPKKKAAKKPAAPARKPQPRKKK
jgi:DnaK suppressor protein